MTDSTDPTGLVNSKSSIATTATSNVTTTGDFTTETNNLTSNSPVPNASELVQAAQLGHLNKIKELFDSESASVTDVSPDGTTALHWAAINNRLSICEYLIEQGAKVDATGGELQATPLHWACRNGLVYIAHLLIQHGADPLRTDSQGFNALHLAVHSSNVLLVIYLLHQGLPVDTVDPAGRTALHWASYQGDALSVNSLLDWGADVKIADSTGFLALHWAIVRGNVTVLKRLIEEGSDVFAKTNDGKTTQVMADEMRTTTSWEQALIGAGRTKEGHVRIKYLNRKSVDLIAFFTPFVIIPLIILTILNAPGILGFLFSISIIGISTMVLNRFVFPNAYFGVHNPIIISPYLAGVFAGSSAWTVVEHLFIILPQTYSQAPFLNFSFTIVFGVMIYSFLKSMLMDPGFVPLLAGVSEQKGVIEELISRGEFDSRHFCVASYIRKPLRSKYDKKYKRVVARFDHNCPWVNNVIGIRNHRFFVIYVTSLFVGILLLDWLYFFPFKSTQSPFKYFTFTSLLVIWDTFQLTWVFLLVFVQFIQISKSVTTSEASNLHRFGFMGADDFSSLPLDHQANAVDDNGSVNATPAFKAANRYKWWNKTLRLLGVDHFLHTAQDTVNNNRLSRSRWKERNPTDNGMYRNCMDFWFPNGHNIFQTFPRGEGSIDGQLVDYYSLFEFAKRKGGQQRDYELLEQQA